MSINYEKGILRTTISLSILWVIFIVALLWGTTDHVEPLFVLGITLIPALVILLIGLLVVWVLRGFCSNAKPTAPTGGRPPSPAVRRYDRN